MSHTRYGISRWAASRWAVPLLAALLLPGLPACDDDRIAGPCVHEYREPIIQLISARDARDGTALSSVVLTNIRVDGRPLEASFLATVGPAYGVIARGDSLVCAIPCGFATDAGNYVFTVSAVGYPPQDRGYQVDYSVSHGGCPSYNDGGVEVELRLWKE